MMAVRQCVVLSVMVMSVCAANPPTVKLPTGGVLAGVKQADGVAAFLGVPFAQPPVGELRFASPVPPQPWTGTRQATTSPPPCIQSVDPYGTNSTANVREDCLYLSVYVPPSVNFSSSSSSSPLLPVMLFLYGGSYVHGWEALPVYNGSTFASDQGVILVAANYRLGLLGYSGSEILRGGNKSVSTGNFGLEDQRAAMMWVRDNIGAFGGDVDQMMVFGESAGSGSTSAHLVAPRSAGLFQHALMQSGPFAGWIAQNMSAAETTFAEFVKLSGCDGGGNDTATVACLRALPAEKVLAIQASMTVTFRPTIDGVEFTQHPIQYAQAGQFSPSLKSVVLGSNRDEGTMFNEAPMNITFSAVDTLLHTMFPRFSDQLKAVYPQSDFKTGWDLMSEIIGDEGFTCPTRRSAKWLANKMQAFEYFFIHSPLRPYFPDTGGVWGAAHSSELPFVFGYAPSFVNADEAQLSKTMNTFWASLVSSGQPSVGSDAPAWPAYNPASDDAMQLDVGASGVKVVTGVRSARCDVWDKYFESKADPTTKSSHVLLSEALATIKV